MSAYFVRAVSAVAAVVLQVTVAVTLGCVPSPPPDPVAIARLAVDRTRAPLGTSVEVAIQFDVAPAFSSLNEDYRVFLSFFDSNEKLLWSYEHDPPVPTSAWQPGRTVEYRREVRIPPYPYLGAAVIAIGLRSPVSGDRLPLAGDDMGEFAYRVAALTLEPRHESSSVTLEDGWHQPEFDVFGRRMWRWTTGQAVLSFQNPRSAVRLTLDVQGPRGRFDRAQRLSLAVDERTLRAATLDTNARTRLGYELTPAELGDSDVVRMRLSVDQTVVPALEVDGSQDGRELGLRVFDVYVEPLP